MQPVRTETTTSVLGAPQGWDAAKDGPCGGLPVTRTSTSFYSYWRPTDSELADIANGKPIRLCVFGSGHPPVMLDTL